MYKSMLFFMFGTIFSNSVMAESNINEFEVNSYRDFLRQESQNNHYNDYNNSNYQRFLRNESNIDSLDDFPRDGSSLIDKHKNKSKSKLYVIMQSSPLFKDFNSETETVEEFNGRLKEIHYLIKDMFEDIPDRKIVSFMQLSSTNNSFDKDLLFSLLKSYHIKIGKTR